MKMFLIGMLYFVIYVVVRELHHWWKIRSLVRQERARAGTADE